MIYNGNIKYKNAAAIKFIYDKFKVGMTIQCLDIDSDKYKNVVITKIISCESKWDDPVCRACGYKIGLDNKYPECHIYNPVINQTRLRLIEIFIDEKEFIVD